MRLYHYTSRANLHNILKEGLRPGSEVEKGEQLPFVMLNNEEPIKKVGNVIHFEVDIDNDDPKLHSINHNWYEYYGSIPAHRLIRVCNPPADIDALVKLVQEHGTASQEYKDAFNLVFIPKIYNSYGEINAEVFDFDFYSTVPPVFRIMVSQKYRMVGFLAEAMFRKNDILDNIQCHGETPDEALSKLMGHLKSHYT